MNPEEINYSGQYLNNTQYRIKIKTGPLANLSKAKKDAVIGELFLATDGVDNADSELYICIKGTTDSDAIFKQVNLT